MILREAIEKLVSIEKGEYDLQERYLIYRDLEIFAREKQRDVHMEMNR